MTKRNPRLNQPSKEPVHRPRSRTRSPGLQLQLGLHQLPLLESQEPRSRAQLPSPAPYAALGQLPSEQFAQTDDQGNSLSLPSPVASHGNTRIAPGCLNRPKRVSRGKKPSSCSPHRAPLRRCKGPQALTPAELLQVPAPQPQSRCTEGQLLPHERDMTLAP